MPLFFAMTRHFDAVLPAPFGKIGVRVSDGLVRELVYLPSSLPEQAPTCALTQSVARQLDAYYDNPHATFNLPLAPAGTAFQQRVWERISAVPCGGVTTYGNIARAIQSAPRAVGQACGANWYPIVIPCHRVVSATGIGGFANHDADGFFLDVKRWLLRHEGVLLT
jgi:methylated-DNA-[protein]-cysteine S-methyltransferase